MEEISQPVRDIRETSRYLITYNRRLQREEEKDVRRSIKENEISSEIVTSIANKLKTKGYMSLTELHTLKNALLDDENNIKIILNTHGALRGLVRELTGSDTYKQYAAAVCCCNLTLSNSRGCMAVSKVAGSYLISSLDSLSKQLTFACALTLGNLASCRLSICETFVAQGVLPRLINLLSNKDEEVVEASTYALLHFTYQLRDTLSPMHLNMIFQEVCKLKLTLLSTRLLFALSCHKDFLTIDNSVVLQKVLEELCIIEKSMSFDDEMFMFLVRVLANVSAGNDSIKIATFITDCNLWALFKNNMDGENSLSKSVCWLLGNLLKTCNENMIFSELLK